MLKRIFFITSLLPLMLQAQISAPGSTAVRMTDYNVTLREDPVFIFCIDDASDRGTLAADTTGGTAPFTFTWMRYDVTGGTFSIPVGSASTAAGLVEGGYSVNITGGGGYDTTLYAWVDLDMPVAGAALKDFRCEMVALDGDTATDHFYYFDPLTGDQRRLANDLSFQWSSVPSSAIPNPTLVLDPITYNPPLADVEYMLQVTDNFGCTSTATFDYTSIHVKASFVVDPITGDAPLVVSFANNSIRNLNNLWTFGDDSISNLADPGPHTYYIPDTYEVTLTIESEQFCTDDTTVTITVNPSDIAIPNVFTPNGDPFNNFFRPETHSLKYLDIQIFAKSGHRVYHYEGNGENLQLWEGWDGKVNNSERDAEPGAYFFVIRAIGYDEKEYSGRERRGYLYLYR